MRGSLVYRAFCRIDGERVPDAKTLIRLSHLLDEAVLKAVLARVVGLARQQRVVRGQRLRVDTTVVETNIHYPTDSTLLADGVRVLTRTMRQLGSGCGTGRAAKPLCRAGRRRSFLHRRVAGSLTIWGRSVGAGEWRAFMFNALNELPKENERD